MKCPNCKNKLTKRRRNICDNCNTELALANSKYKNAIVGAISGATGYWLYKVGFSKKMLIIMLCYIIVMVLISLVMVRYKEVNNEVN